MPGFGIRFSSNAPTSVIGKIFTSLFFFIFLAMGSFFLWLIVREEWGALRTWTWQKTPCEILSSRVRETDDQGRRSGGFHFDVSYRYAFGGQTYTSDRYKRGSQSFSDYRKAARLTEQYPGESKTSCYVNPSTPAEAVLVRDDFYLLFFALIPLVFIAIGAGSIYFTWRHKPAADANAQAISERASPAKGQRFTVVFCSLFLLVGGAMFYGMCLRPVLKIMAAHNWTAVPCVVISSEVETHSDSDGSTYSVNILYSYEVNGREFRSNRYHFMGGSSSGYDGKRAVVNQHPPGTRTVCYVNPADPTEAVLERGFTPDLWFGLIPLAFIAFGAIGLTYSLRNSRKSEAATGVARSIASSGSSRSAMAVSSAARSSESVVLNPKTAPWVKLVGVTLAAAFWNGIVSLFAGHVLAGWRSGNGEWFPTLFLTPFVLIGLGLILGIGYYFLALFNPRARLRIAPGAVPLGSDLRVEWELTGRTGVLQKLELRLQGREEAKYRRGTSTCMDKNLFADIELAVLTTPSEIRSGTRIVTIPGNLMHSFASKNNSIIWSLRLHGDIPRWPDISEEFPLTVLPAVRTAKEEL
jgi:hypothetical protein